MPTNDFLPFCNTDTGTNLLTQADYLASSGRTSGNQPGIASSKLNNKGLRQATAIISQFAQWICNTTGVDLPDDGNLSNLLTKITNALTPSVTAIPQMTVLTSGAATYTVPANCRYLDLFMLGGGGGGAGSGTGSSAGAGVNGGSTTFVSGGVSLSAAGGAGGAVNGVGGAGGGGSLGIVTSGYIIGGGSGGPPANLGASPNSDIGGVGGSSWGGGAGAASGSSNTAVPGGNAVANSGGGGGGGSGFGVVPVFGGAGGGAAGYLYARLSGGNLLASYAFSIAAGGGGGAAGTSGISGGNGGTGLIVLNAYF